MNISETKTLNMYIGEKRFAGYVTAFVFACFWSVPVISADQKTNQTNYRTLTIKTLHVARTRDQRKRGFMGWESLRDNEGMIFIFPYERRQCFWMKDTRLDLDVLLLNEENRVVDVIYNMKPLSQEKRCFKVPGKRALEIASRPRYLRLKVGDLVILPRH